MTCTDGQLPETCAPRPHQCARVPLPVAVLTSISDAEALVVAREYALGELVRLEGIPAGSVNSNFALVTDKGRYFLRIYEEQGDAGARAEGALLAKLAAAGVATPAPIARADGTGTIGAVASKPAAVFPWTDGTHRCQASVTRDDCRRVGAALAAVHCAGEGTVRGLGRFRYEDLLERIARITTARDTTLAAQAPVLRAKLDQWTARRDASLPRGVIHGDLFRDNVLWKNDGSIAALLDFESASDGVLAYDLMVTALAWCFGDALDMALLSAMIDGYESIRPLDDAEKRSLVAEGCVAATRFTITRITDYAMRVTDGPRVIKDWRRFAARLAALEAIDSKGESVGVLRRVDGSPID